MAKIVTQKSDRVLQNTKCRSQHSTREWWARHHD